MKLASTAFENNEMIPLEYTCEGEGVNPPLSISEVPENTQSLALIIEDPDAPGETFTHWLVWNIGPKIEELEEGEVPSGAKVGLNSTGSSGYLPPCPPSGTHHYLFHLYALDQMMDLPTGSEREVVEEAMKGHILVSTQLIGIYQKKESENLVEEEVF